jgi:hypothetical protein
MTDLRLVPPPPTTPLTGDLGDVGFGWLNTAMLVTVGLFIGVVLASGAVAILGASPPEPPVVATNAANGPYDGVRLMRTPRLGPPTVPISPPNALNDMRRWADAIPTPVMMGTKSVPNITLHPEPVAHRIAPRGVYRPAPRRVIIPEPQSGYIGCPPSVCSPERSSR